MTAYPFVVVAVEKRKIAAGNEYRSDALDAAKDLPPDVGPCKVYTAEFAKRYYGLDVRKSSDWLQGPKAKRKRKVHRSVSLPSACPQLGCGMPLAVANDRRSAVCLDGHSFEVRQVQ